MSTPSALHIVCPHCHTTNRVQAGDQAKASDCGQCHRPLFEGEPLELDAGSFDKHLARNQIALVVDFWAPWCGPCLQMAPFFHEAAIALEPQARLAKLDTEAQPQIAARYGIRSIPTMIVFKGGQEVARTSGAMATEGITRWIRSVL
ncbi:thioredoxin TrxC [Comamonas flocculans]|uniref:Thioredoxin n=1 Tax=Comamonas flocculans TaxID=2597701 RepID=A0A5B8RVN8_9BURK|nr:thioredoxin TrxC [Comamonas flocculans]QEA13193.1 thioredoxin TrxC [Comamonas flocculans]